MKHGVCEAAGVSRDILAIAESPKSFIQKPCKGFCLKGGSCADSVGVAWMWQALLLSLEAAVEDAKPLVSPCSCCPRQRHVRNIHICPGEEPHSSQMRQNL